MGSEMRVSAFLFVSVWLVASVAVAQPAAIGNCSVFPSNNIWNTPIDQLPVAPNSTTYITTIGGNATMHADFGSGLYAGAPIGIPFITVPGTQTKYPATFLYSSESDPGPYAVPLNAPIEGGSQSTGDRHSIAIDIDNCILYELGRAFPQTASWQADAGAIFNLASNALRPATWTSTDAAGLPIFPGLARYDEIAAGEIRHALRFTVPQTQRAFLWPARHDASSLTDPKYPPMGLRVRLQASFDISGFSPTNQIILRALKKYGMILADNGSAWYVSGAPDPRWDNNDLHNLGVITGSNFEVVDVSPLMADPNSGQIKQVAASLGVAKTHSGNFTPGQAQAIYSVTVSNSAGAGPASGTVTVTETVPAGLTLGSMAGTGWSCAANNCSRGDSLAAGTSYPPITVTVTVAGNAPAQVTNQVTVSGGGSASATAADLTNVGAACAFAINPINPAAVPNGGAGSVLVTTSGGCAWSAASNSSWISIASGSPATSSGSLGFNAAPNTTGTQRSGTLTVAGQTVTVTQAASNPSQGPALLSLNPFQGAGPNSTLTLVYSHSSGWAAINSAEFILNPRWEASSRAGGCYVKYAPAAGLFTLIADDGISVAGKIPPGSAGAISNSQCSLNAAGSSATGSGTTLTVVVSLTFSATFTGQRHIWMQAIDYNNLTTNWLVYGVWFPTQTTVHAGPWYRIYDPNTKTFLYSADQNEYNTLGAEGFTLQGTAGLVMDSPAAVGGVSNIAWYRIYVNATSSHLWTSDRNEFLTLINTQQAYVGEGVAAFVMPYINALGQVSTQVTNTIPFYRAAYQGANLHFWTSDPNEYFGLNGSHLPAGYLGEGIASYIFPASGAQLGSVPMAPAGMDDGFPVITSVVNGASYVRNATVTPGQVLTIYGHRFAGQLLLNGKPAQVISARNDAIRILVPDELGDATEVRLEVEYRGHRTTPMTLTVAQADPAIFVDTPYGRGNAQARNEDGHANDPQHPAARGSVVTLYTTGMAANAKLPLEAHIGGHAADVLSTWLSPARPGVVEVKIRVPKTIDPAAFQPVVLHLANLFTQPGVGLAIQ